jgi:hypothetical protein
LEATAVNNPQARDKAIADSGARLGLPESLARDALSELWDLAFEEGRLAALDEFQDRFCVCSKA